MAAAGLQLFETIILPSSTKLFLRAPPPTFPRVDGTIKTISLPEDVYVKKFFQKHPDSKYEDAIKYDAPLLHVVCHILHHPFLK